MRQDLPQARLSTRHPVLDVVDDKYCTVVFRLQGGNPTMSEFLLELSLHVESSGTVEIVRYQVGDYLGHTHS